MKFYYLKAFVLAILFGTGCSQKAEDTSKSAVVEGHFTVSDSVDASKDFSGIGLTIIKKDSANAQADTLFHQITDSTGFLSGAAHFPQKKQYPAFVSRNGRNIGRFGIILADNDTVRISAELPDLQQTLRIQSEEHTALEVYRRVDKNFQRIARLARLGRLQGDSLGTELNKWSNLYWQVYQDYKETLAGELAVSESIRLLQGWNNQAMMERVRAVQDKDEFTNLAATYGKKYLAENKGLDYTLSYLDTLQQITSRDDMSMRIKMERIKLLYDSARIDQAKEHLQAFKKQYDIDREAKKWVESISYDLNYLSPGDTIPPFSFRVNGKTISRDSLLGTPYILEISTLANPLYQDQYDRTVVIHSLYKNFGLQVVTIPLDNSQVTTDAFFEERVRPWPVAPADAFDRQKLLERFNIQLIPTRFLIDKQGKIVRKYVGREYADIIQGIQSIIKKDKQAS